ncbi:NmrA/HSCARG family protein [Paenibacillus sp. P26]|nr:NmrA/HSCARG family protein [Paenibacillus sp. P26]UUZ92766.1 NmrA/HSCARG family protein [Paenibacillus sp. P25]
MASQKKTILVIGGTGQQGGAAARSLLASGWSVRLLVRDTNNKEAESLRFLGAEIVQGDLDYPSSVYQAMEGVYGVFSVQAFRPDDLIQEIRHGQTIADAAKATDVTHFVYSSAAGADRGTKITAFENKGRLERYIRSLHPPATILRPVMFMENFKTLLQSSIGSIAIPYIGSPETKVQMIAVRDIGVFASLVFSSPETYIGKNLEISGDELTLAEALEAIHRVFGVPVHYEIPSKPRRDDSDEHDGVKATAFFDREGYLADLSVLRQMHPELLDFPSWLEQLKHGKS